MLSEPHCPPRRVAFRRYLTRGDITPPAIRVVSAASPAPGHVFLAPKRACAQAGPPAAVVTVEALDASGEVLDRSETITVGG